MTDIYRVIKRETSSLQPGGGTYWTETVLYCGTDRDEARIAYHESVPSDRGGSYGNSCAETVSRIIRDGKTDDFDDDEVVKDE